MPTQERGTKSSDKIATKPHLVFVEFNFFLLQYILIRLEQHI